MSARATSGPRLDIDRLLARATGLSSRRLASKGHGDARSLELGRRRLDRWRRLSAAGDRELFAERLRRGGWQDLDDEELAARLGAPAPEPAGPAPPWALVVEQALDAWRRGEGEDLLDLESPLPFGDIVVGFTTVARTRLLATLGAPCDARKAGRASESALRQMLQRLLATLAHMAAPSLHRELQAFRATGTSGLARRLASAHGRDRRTRRDLDGFYDHLRSGGLERLLENYAVLARMLGTLVLQWVEAAGEMLQRLEHDAPEVARLVGLEGDDWQVRRADGHLSDRHRGGRSVWILELAHRTAGAARKVVYKPRCLAVDRAFRRLVLWIGERGFGPSLRTAPALPRDGYGWMAFIEARPCDGRAAAGRFFERLGAWLALLHVLGATDLHYENLIADGEHPVPIDLETLLQPHLAMKEGPPAAGARGVAERLLRESVLRTALLPRWQEIERQSFDLTALGDAAPERGVWRGRWRDAGTDAVAPVLEHDTAPTRTHLPRFAGPGGELHPASPAEHGESLEAGFTNMHAFLHRHRHELLRAGGPLHAFTGLRLRFILRPTRIYGCLLHAAGLPDRLREALDHELELEAAARALLAEPRELWPIFEHERSALERRDVPIFDITPSSRHLRLEDGVLEDFFEQSSLEQVRQRLEAPPRSEHQMRFLRRSLAVRYHDEAPLPALPPSRDARLAAAFEIAELFADEAIRGDGAVTWFGPRRLASGEFQLDPLGHGLADGLGGPALLFAALAARGHESGLLDAVLESWRLEWRAALGRVETPGPGLADGWGGALLVPLLSARLTGRTELLDEAVSMALSFEPPDRGASQGVGVLDGTGGVALVLEALYHASGDTGVLERARASGAPEIGEKSDSLEPALHRLARAARREDDRLGRLLMPSMDFHPGFFYGHGGWAYRLLSSLGPSLVPPILS